MPLSFWWDAFNTAVYLINRLPTLLLNNQSPMRKLYHQEPDFSFLPILDVPIFHTSDHIIRTSLISIHSNAYSWVIVVYTKDTSAQVPQEKFI